MNSLAKQVLKFDEDYDCFLWGITSSQRDYRLCWIINNALDLDMIRMDNHKVTKPSEKMANNFSRFAYYNELDQVEYNLLSNKNQGNILIAGLQKIDYFFILKENYSFLDLSSMQLKLNENKAIQLLMKLDFNTIKQNQNLIFE